MKYFKIVGSILLLAGVVGFMSGCSDDSMNYDNDETQNHGHSHD